MVKDPEAPKFSGQRNDRRRNNNNRRPQRDARANDRNEAPAEKKEVTENVSA
jgi:hypothetical protein